MIDIALRAQFERGGFHALGGGEFVGARAVQPSTSTAESTTSSRAAELVELRARVGVALTASRLDAGLCVNYDLMARLTIKSKLVPDEIKKLHDLLKKKLCEVNRGSRWAGPPEIIQLARKLFDPSGTYATADSESFDKGGKPRTVTAHYRIAYGIELQYPWLPLLAVDCGATWYVKASTHVRNGEALPPQNNAYEFFDVKNTDADVQRWLVLDVTGSFLPRQAIAQFFDLVGRSLCDRGLKHWPEWDYHMINPRDIENFVRDLGAKSARARPDYVTPIIIKDKTKAMSPSKPYDRLKKAFGGKVMTGCVGIETIQKQRAGSAELSKLATSLANNIVGKLGVVVKRTFPAAPNLQGGGAFPPERLPESSAAHPLLKEKTLLVSVHVEQGGGAFCQNVSSFVSMVAAKTEFCDEFIERHAPVEPGADIASALTPFGEIVYGFLELFEKSADQMMAVRLIQEAQPSAWFYGTRESLAHFTNPTASVAIYKGGRLEGYADPPWSRADGAAPIASLDRGSRAKFDGASQIRHAERCFDFKIIVLRGGFGASENLEVEPPYLEDALGKLGLQRLQNAGMPDDELTRINDVPGYFFY
ncbi:dienelactone hydrolase-like protein [Aureococcus anophagefferens]|nr:dienelactone hydrolase-like protein [Aureococcus anophagefferens]